MSDPVRGVCVHLLALDLGFQIDLAAAQQLLADSERPRVVRARRPAPAWFEYEPAPLRVSIECEPIEVAGRPCEPVISCVIHEFGAMSLAYRFDASGPLQELPQLTAALYDNERVYADARLRAARLLEAMRPAVQRPALGELMEDYTVLALRHWGGRRAAEFVAEHAETIARALQAETGPLSEAAVLRCVESRLSYSPRDLAIIDWNAALLLDEEPDDIITLLAHANVELLEMRVLDEQLDGLLERAHVLLGRFGRRRFWAAPQDSKDLRIFAEIQTDGALLFEGVNNAIKLVGDQYLARVYQLTAERLHLPRWDASVERKLATAESVYQKMTDAAATRRLETLEWIIIVLILVSIVVMFVPSGH